MLGILTPDPRDSGALSSAQAGPGDVPLSQLERARSAHTVRPDVSVQEGTAPLHAKIFSCLWEMELSGSPSGSCISSASTEKRQNRWDEELK